MGEPSSMIESPNHLEWMRPPGLKQNHTFLLFYPVCKKKMVVNINLNLEHVKLFNMFIVGYSD